jgi:hypothetical protein
VGRVALLIGSRSACLPPSDRAAVALALRLSECVVQAYCRPGDDEARRYALAAGAVSAVEVASAAEIERAGFDLLLVGEGGAGESGTDEGGDLLLAHIAERRGCAMVFEVLEVEENGQGLLVTRDLGRGAREVLRVEGAAVLGVSAQAPRGRYISRYRRQAAGGWSGAADAAAGAAGVGLGAWEPARPRARTGDLAARTAPPADERILALFGLAEAEGGGGGKKNVIEADPETCARHLLRFLAHHRLIGRRRPRPPGRAEAPAPAEEWEAAARSVHEAERSREPERAGVAAGVPATGKLGRGPRPVGQERPSRIRGPFRIDTHA